MTTYHGFDGDKHVATIEGHGSGWRLSTSHFYFNEIGVFPSIEAAKRFWRKLGWRGTRWRRVSE